MRDLRSRQRVWTGVHAMRVSVVIPGKETVGNRVLGYHITLSLSSFLQDKTLTMPSFVISRRHFGKGAFPDFYFCRLPEFAPIFDVEGWRADGCFDLEKAWQAYGGEPETGFLSLCDREEGEERLTKEVWEEFALVKPEFGENDIESLKRIDEKELPPDIQLLLSELRRQHPLYESMLIAERDMFHERSNRELSRVSGLPMSEIASFPDGLSRDSFDEEIFERAQPLRLKKLAKAFQCLQELERRSLGYVMPEDYPEIDAKETEYSEEAVYRETPEEGEILVSSLEEAPVFLRSLDGAYEQPFMVACNHMVVNGRVNDMDGTSMRVPKEIHDAVKYLETSAREVALL